MFEILLLKSDTIQENHGMYNRRSFFFFFFPSSSPSILGCSFELEMIALAPRMSAENQTNEYLVTLDL